MHNQIAEAAKASGITEVDDVVAFALGFKSAAVPARLRRPCLKAQGDDDMTLSYFDLPALGEPPRLLLALSGEKWSDHRVTRKEWNADKTFSKYGQMPMLTLPNGRVMAQSTAISRYLAKGVFIDASPLYPEDPMEAFCVDEIIETFADFHKGLYKSMAIKDQAEKEAARQKHVSEEGGKIFGVFEKAATEWMVGDKMTLADIWLFYYFNFLQCGFWDGLKAGCVSQFPKLNAIKKKVGAIDAIKSYYKALGKASWPGVDYTAFLDA